MNDTIIYRPYKTQTWALIVTIPIGMLAFVGAGYCLPISSVGVLYLTGIGFVCIWLTKVLYDASQRTIAFEKKGLRIIGGSYFDYRYIPWEKLTYARYAKNYKGHLFLILSSDVLNHKAAKHFANQGANLSKIYIDGVVSIYIDNLQDVSSLRKIIENYVTHIDMS